MFIVFNQLNALWQCCAVVCFLVFLYIIWMFYKISSVPLFMCQPIFCLCLSIALPQYVYDILYFPLAVPFTYAMKFLFQHHVHITHTHKPICLAPRLHASHSASHHSHFIFIGDCHSFQKKCPQKHFAFKIKAILL